MTRPGMPRLVVFAAGDFACNLYWQSLTLFLFFFYTETLGLAPGRAGSIYFVGSVWAGVADLLVGIHAQKSPRGYRRLVRIGALPLGLSFGLLYVVPPLTGLALAGFALAAHLLFRSLYALVNVPYAALGARISDDSQDRAVLAGLRMMFGTAAAVVVALATRPIGAMLGARASFTPAAVAFAATGTLVLLAAVRAAPREPAAVPGDAPSIAACLRVLAANAAFRTLTGASIASGIAGAVIGQSVLYYFAYVVGEPARGPATLALMGIGGALAVPVWIALARRIGVRGTWLAAASLGLPALAALAVAGAAEAQALLVVLQAALVGFSFAHWAMLPDTVEYGEHAHGVRVEAMAFGVSALIQKVALGLAVGGMGLGYEAIGYVAGAPQTATARAGMLGILIAVPAVAIAVSALAMLANPLRRGTHQRIVIELAARREG